MTRALVVADTSDNWTTETLSAAHFVDVILTLGDMYLIDLERLKGGAPILGVYGNHCRPGYLKEAGAVELAPSDVPIAWSRLNNGLAILGVSGCVRYSNAAYHQNPFTGAPSVRAGRK